MKRHGDDGIMEKQQRSRNAAASYIYFMLLLFGGRRLNNDYYQADQDNDCEENALMNQQSSCSIFVRFLCQEKEGR